MTVVNKLVQKKASFYGGKSDKYDLGLWNQLE